MHVTISSDGGPLPMCDPMAQVDPKRDPMVHVHFQLRIKFFAPFDGRKPI